MYILFSSVQSLSRVWLFATPWITARQASLSITSAQSSLRLTSIESVMPSSHLILCHPLLLLPPMPPSIRVFSNESTLRMRWRILSTEIKFSNHQQLALKLLSREEPRAVQWVWASVYSQPIIIQKPVVHSLPALFHFSGGRALGFHVFINVSFTDLVEDMKKGRT